MLIPIRGRCRISAGGYSWSGATEEGGPRDWTLAEAGNLVHWQTIEDSNIATELAAIVPTDRDSVQAFLARWGLPILPPATRHHAKASIRMSALVQLVRHVREALALSSVGDMQALVSHFHRHAHVASAIRYDHAMDRSQPQLFVECADPASLAWCQLVMGTGAHGEHRRCGQCGAFFSVASADGHRRSRQFCSDRCRVAANRAKKRGISDKLNHG